MLDDLSLFIAIVAAGSLSQAAKNQSIPTATLTRRLQQLEKTLGCKLLHRTTRGIQLTHEGQSYYERCQPLISSLQQATQELSHHILDPIGQVKLLAPINLANTILKAFWASFLHKYPDIRLEICLDNKKDHLLSTGADLALRIGQQQDTSYIQKYICSLQTMIVASPQYLAQAPNIYHPNDLKIHNWIIAQPLSIIKLQRNHEQIEFKLENFRAQITNEMQICTELALHGLGLCYLPENVCKAEIVSGRLIKVLPEWQTPVRDIYAIWPSQKLLPTRVRVVVEDLVAYMANLG
ncbi:LysR family transcriptional regulator [Acinetobacter sp. WCHAc060042]|uniref:LysR family transcriptional regulator n=1 Tax=Acinetobacter sp. WCHAc060042 TaxID=2213016 RepID=UPI000DA6CABB|nr:LysR family transcriptional regulator [Acinetobacter sp. WCHAc060042]